MSVELNEIGAVRPPRANTQLVHVANLAATK